MVSPMPQIRGVGDPHVSARRSHRPVDHGPVAVDFVGQEGGILVFGRHDDTESLEALEVFGQGQRNTGTSTGEGGICHCILLEFGNVCDARVFDTPDFFGVVVRVGQKRRLGVNPPAVHSILRACRAKMGQTSSVLHTAKQERIASRQTHCGCIEDAVNRIGPILAGQDGVAVVARQ